MFIAPKTEVDEKATYWQVAKIESYLPFVPLPEDTIKDIWDNACDLSVQEATDLIYYLDSIHVPPDPLERLKRMKI